MKASKTLIAQLSSSKQSQSLHIYTLPELDFENTESRSESIYYSIEELIPYFFNKISTNSLNQIFKSTNSEYDLIKDENSGMTMINSDYLNDIAIQNQWYTLALLSKENKFGLLTGKINKILESLRLPNIQIYSNFPNISLEIKPARLRSISVPPGNPNTSPMPGPMDSENSPKTNQTNSSTPQFKPMIVKKESQSMNFEYNQRSHQPPPDSLRMLDTCLPSATLDYPPKRAIPRYTPTSKALVPPTYSNPTARARGRPRKLVTNPYPQTSISPSLGHFGHFKIDPPPQEMILLPPTTPSTLRPRYHSPPVHKSPIQPIQSRTQPVHRPPFEPKLRPSLPASHQLTGSDHPLEWCRKEVYSLIDLSSELRYRLLKLEECMSNLQPHQPSSLYVPSAQSQPYTPIDPKSFSPYNRPAPPPERQ